LPPKDNTVISPSVTRLSYCCIIPRQQNDHTRNSNSYWKSVGAKRPSVCHREHHSDDTSLAAVTDSTTFKLDHNISHKPTTIIHHKTSKASQHFTERNQPT
jgi:hypothetical protein